MSLYTISIDPANVDPDGFVTAANTVEDTALTLAATSAGDSLAHRLNFVSAGNMSAVTFAVVGTDADDKVISESVTGPNATTVESVKYFKTITSITPDATDAVNTIEIGWVDEVASKTYPLNWRSNSPAGIFKLDVTGTINVDVQFFVADPGRYSEQSLIPSNVDVDLDGETADVFAYIEEQGYTGFRVIVNSYTDTAELTLYAAQP